VDEAEDVVVGPDQEGDRVRVRLVGDQHAGIHMAVRGDEREVGHPLVQLEGHPPYGGVGRQQAVRVRERGHSSGRQVSGHGGKCTRRH
jgi:hypothetical protein